MHISSCFKQEIVQSGQLLSIAAFVTLTKSGLPLANIFSDVRAEGRCGFFSVLPNDAG